MTQKTYHSWRRLALGAALAAAIGASPSAMAGNSSLTLDFDDLGPQFIGAGDDPLNHKGLQLSAYSVDPDVQRGDLLAAIFDGNDASMCMGLSCPVNDGTPGYYAGLNGSALVIGSSQPAGLHIKSFDASFIGGFPRQGYDQYYPDVAGLLEVRGFKADGSYVSERYQLTGTFGANFYMSHYDASAAFASQSFTQIAIFAYSCNFAGNCMAFGDNSGQFALDNLALDVSAVPEPSSWMMLLGGLGAVATIRRRRSA